MSIYFLSIISWLGQLPITNYVNFVVVIIYMSVKNILFELKTVTGKKNDQLT